MSQIVDFSGRNITVKTLTVRQVKDLVEEFKKSEGQLNIVDLLFNDEITASAVCAATKLKMTELEGDVHPQAVMDLIDAVRAENPFFVGMMERMVTVGKSRLAQNPSSGLSAV